MLRGVVPVRVQMRGLRLEWGEEKGLGATRGWLDSSV